MLNMTARVAILAAAAATLVFPFAASAEPATAWRTRNTGLDTDGKCTRRAFSAMKNADLAASASGNVGVLGKGGGVHAYVICQNSGAQAAIFCAADGASAFKVTTSVCDTIARYMVP